MPYPSWKDLTKNDEDAFLLPHLLWQLRLTMKWCFSPIISYSDNFDWQWNDAFLLPHPTKSTSIETKKWCFSLATFYSDNYFSSAFIFSTFPSFILTSPTVLFLYFPPAVRPRNDCLYWSWPCILFFISFRHSHYCLTSSTNMGLVQKNRQFKIIPFFSPCLIKVNYTRVSATKPTYWNNLEI